MSNQTTDLVAAIRARWSEDMACLAKHPYLQDDPEWQNERDVCALLGEIERLDADAARYRWLKSRIAPTIIQRINPKAIDTRSEALDAVIDLKRERAPDVGEKR